MRFAKNIGFVTLALCAALLSACGGSAAAPTPRAPIVTAPPPAQPVSTVLPIPPPPPAGDDFHPSNKGWVPVWADEFGGNSLDRTKWEAEQSCWGGGNDERQCYTDRPENIEVVNGLLRLKAYPETFTGPQYPQGWPSGPGPQITQAYTSGKVRTRELADWTYGRFSARIKLPGGQGTWPAFWMLPADNVYGDWAASGEIDIMEAVNLGASCSECTGAVGENRTSGALHYGAVWPNNTFQAKHTTLQGGDEAKDQYHVYALEWGEGRINWFVDGVKFFTLDAETWDSGAVDKDTHPFAPFDQDFYLMFNLAVGGRLSEDNNDRGFNTSSFPAEVLVDWVRVYQCEFDGTSGRNCMDGEGP